MRSRFVLFGFDGPICRLFAGHSAEWAANSMMEWLEGRGLHGLLTEAERNAPDLQVILHAVDRRHPSSDLVSELEERVTREEMRAVSSAMPTGYADPLIRTWTALGGRLAIATNHSSRAVQEYLSSRGLMECFAPRIYGRTQALESLKPNPHNLNRALSAMGAAPSAALMIGDTPSDFIAASRAGVSFLGFARNERTAKHLREAGAELIVESLEPVLRVLRSR
ncbi:HAD hydrolase-like protein [Streptomyces sp. MBT53]|uniref:HAD family hydrolase n=1 Tax=Streptomyces sp. MBT53 TaxID=1488384 RepID=UPI0027DA99F3|nr:HAD hydrolase-like protein [Streptomyces sp. MBT53]